MPPFAGAMVDFLKECNARANRPFLIQSMMTGANAKYEGDKKLMTDLADDSEHDFPLVPSLSFVYLTRASIPFDSRTRAEGKPSG